MNIQFPIYKHQLGSFKRHAAELGKAINALNNSYLIQGSKRVNYLAEACGYKNHTDLVHRAASVSDQKILGLFAPGTASQLARLYAEISGFPYEYVFAGMINAADELYESEGEKDFRWIVKHVMQTPTEVQNLVIPPIKLNIPTFNQSIFGKTNMGPFGKTASIFKNNSVFKLGETLRSFNEISNVMKSIHVNTEALRVATRALPTFQSTNFLKDSNLEAICNSAKMVESIHTNPEALRAVALGAICNSAKAVESIVTNPAMRMATDIDKLYPPYLQSFDKLIPKV